ncbi:MAG: septum formation inhibitor Maf [Crocinitomicaceae bacterium]|nr:septum formation inhibitor Maf [Crocinitomicaceae bacterium]
MKYRHLFILLVLFVTSCTSGNTKVSSITNSSTDSLNNITGISSKEDANYWYNNKAEITSYKLTQARYGELHEGTAVFVFVTEPFSPSSNTKADIKHVDNVSVLKLNQTRKFTTGVYPYSIMTSTFFPFKKGDHSLKTSSSCQEWCGHTYMELRNEKKMFEVKLNSYFEGESYSNTKMDKALLEDDIWSMIKIRNQNLPTGNLMMYPSMSYSRLAHIDYKPYNCELTILPRFNYNTYQIHYPELERTVTINYLAGGTFEIQSWTETYLDGFGSDRKILTTKAEKMKTINSAYWQKNHLSDSTLRKKLNL